jgi:hypothetical protein
MNIGKTGNFRVTVENTVGNKFDCHLQEQIRPGLWKTVDTKTVPFVHLALLDFEKRVEKEEAKIGA